MFRRARFTQLIDAQLDLFRREHPDELEDVAERLRAYNEAPREDAEELYGDYVDAVETGTVILADMRDHYARTLEEADAERFVREFNNRVARQLPQYALEIENR